MRVQNSLYLSLLPGNLAERSSRETASSAILRRGSGRQAVFSPGFRMRRLCIIFSPPFSIIRLDRYCMSFCALVPFRIDFRWRHFFKPFPAVLLRGADRGKREEFRKERCRENGERTRSRKGSAGPACAVAGSAAFRGGCRCKCGHCPG